MARCIDTIIRTIGGEECLGQSLQKINDNFNSLAELACTLKERIEASKEIRTFFYYGPNAEIAPASGLDNNQLSRPSDETIESFVNSPSELNLTAISNLNDIAYVIYQKTGFQGTLPSQSSGFNPETGSPEIYTSGRSVSLNMDSWYNVDDYYSVAGSVELGSEPIPGEPTDAGTIILKFKSPDGQISEYTYNGSGEANNVIIEWDPDNVSWSEEDPIPRVVKGIIPRPFKTIPGSQFLFTATGFYESNTLSGFIKKTSRVPAVDFSNTNINLTNQYLPTFIIWKLVYLSNGYLVELGYPKFMQSLGTGTNWNNPETWSTYDSVDQYTPEVELPVLPLSDQLYSETIQGLNRQVASTSERLDSSSSATPIPPEPKPFTFTPGVIPDSREDGGGGGEETREQKVFDSITKIEGTVASSGASFAPPQKKKKKKKKGKLTGGNAKGSGKKIQKPEHKLNKPGNKISGGKKNKTNLAKVQSTDVKNDQVLIQAKQKIKKHFEKENIKNNGKFKNELIVREKQAKENATKQHIQNKKRR